jgi:hypothetical protein
MDAGIGFAKRKLINEIITQNFSDEKNNFNKNELLFVIQELLDQEGKKYLEGRTSKRGYEIFRQFMELLLYRNLANFDSMILITADKGSGKSSAAMMMARYWCKLIGIKFNPGKHIAYNNADLMNKIDNLNKFEPIICDEAVRFASAADWAKADNKDLKKKLAQVRTKHLLYILCFPLKVYKLENSYLQSFTNYWIHLMGRGKGSIFVKDMNPVKDSWRLKDFEKLSSFNEFTQMSKVEEILKRHPNFWMNVKFPKPPVWLYDKYLKVREHNIYDDESILQNVSKQDMHNALLVIALRDIMLQDTSLGVNRILLHIKNEYDISLSKKIVNECIDDAKQLVAKIREKTLQI